MDPIDNGMGIEVIVASENDVHQIGGEILSQFVIIWLALMADSNNKFGACFSELFRKLLGCLRCRFIDQIRWQRVDCV